jgi:excisionase family DNA binding protein
MEATVAASPYLTYAEAARYARCDRSTLWRAVRRGDLRASGPAGTRRVLFRVEDLNDWLRSRSR